MTKAHTLTADPVTETGSAPATNSETARTLPRGEAICSALVLAQIQSDPGLGARPVDDLLCHSLECAARVYGLVQVTEETPPVLKRLLPQARQLIEELRALAEQQPAACRPYVENAEQRHTRRGHERAADVIAWCVVNDELERLKPTDS